MEKLTIVISILALVLSILTFQWNKAKHNLNQLQDNAKKFCDNLQKFIELGTEHKLTLYKYEIESLYYLTDYERFGIAYNNLQIEFSKRKDVCKNCYKELMETLDFFEIQGIHKENELVKWLNEMLNNYYLKLNKFYEDLFEINIIVRASERDLLTLERINFVNLFFDNIRDLLDYNGVFSLFKRDIRGYFGKLSLMNVGLFGKTKRALMKIEIDIMRFIKELGLDEAIKERDYSKIRKQYLGFANQYDEFIASEKEDFLQFLSVVKDIKKSFK